MEDVRSVYQQAACAGIARLCFDEQPYQLVEQVVAPLPMQAQQALREDSDYERKGTACTLLAYDIDTGQRYTQVRKQRTKKDYTEFMHWLICTHYPHIAQVALVQDNLNTHNTSSFYEHLPADQARALAQKMQFHYTPQHGSWLNMVEIEFAALRQQCLDRRIASFEKLQE